MATINLNGREFELIKSKRYTIEDEFDFHCTGRTLHQIYKYPSIEKQLIYDGWINWANEFNNNLYDECIICFGCYNGNSFSFTMRGILLIEGVTYGLMITKNHNRCFVLK